MQTNPPTFPEDGYLLGVLKSVIGNEPHELYTSNKNLLSNTTIEADSPEVEKAVIESGLGPRYAFKTPIHREMTQETLTEDFNAIDLETIMKASEDQDGALFGQLHPEYHYDSNRLIAGEAFVHSQYEIIARTTRREEALEAFGRLLHAQQDFYSHTNYIELYRDYYRSIHGTYPRPSQIPLYEDARKDPNLDRMLQQKLISGEFSVDEFLQKDLWHLNRKPTSHAMMNQDKPDKPLFREAQDLAERQTLKELEKFKETVKQNSWLPFFREKSTSEDRLA